MATKKAATIVCVALVAFSLAWLFFLERPDATSEGTRPGDPTSPERPGDTSLSGLAPAPIDPAAEPGRDGGASADVPDAGRTRPRPIGRLHDIEEIKEQIYAMEIESIDRVHLLDELVQTGDRDTRELWEEAWGGVDDWKSTHNGFHLERNDDGSLVFIPDEATTRMYTFFENLEIYAYDEERKEFVNEVDYYGKRIYNVIKFIDDEALAMMTISGAKVDLQIYQKTPERE